MPSPPEGAAFGQAPRWSCLLMVAPNSYWIGKWRHCPQARSCEEAVGVGPVRILKHFPPSSGQRPEALLTVSQQLRAGEDGEPAGWGWNLPRPPHASPASGPQPSWALPGQHSPNACLLPEKPPIPRLRVLGERISQDLGLWRVGSAHSP